MSLIFVTLLVFFTNKFMPAYTSYTYNVTVSKDNSGDYSTITEAVRMAPNNSVMRSYIYIKAGVYEEYVVVEAQKINISFIGDKTGITVISGSKSFMRGVKTSETATLSIFGAGFIGIGLRVENLANDSSQAVALLSSAKHTIYYMCSFVGYQDTLYASDGAQFFRDCTITGTVDFIFGNANGVFQNCEILLRTPLVSNLTSLVVTAQSRVRIDGKEGFVFHNCTIKASINNFPETLKVYLGRPWRDFSRTIIIQSFPDKIIDPKGWMEWSGEPRRQETCYYAEYGNRGLGSNTIERVKWRGYKKIDKTQANQFSVRNFIGGENWILQTGIPVNLDLI